MPAIHADATKLVDMVKPDADARGRSDWGHQIRRAARLYGAIAEADGRAATARARAALRDHFLEMDRAEAVAASYRAQRAALLICSSPSPRRHGPVADGYARRVAAEWCAGDLPGFTGLLHTGAINGHALRQEIRDAVSEVHATPGQYDNAAGSLRDLSALARYVHAHGDRGPVSGWSDVTFQHPDDEDA